MNYEQTLNYIHSLGKFSHKAGLERMTEVLRKLGDPQKKQRFIHIAGTNGKGSVCTFTASVLRAAGYKTGLYISPFVINFRERIQINGKFIPEDSLCALSQTVIDTKVALTEFEFITAVAFLYFAKENCDIVVLETGLGGRLDATNTAENVLVSVITKIGLDHTAILGSTIEEITAEKCGIIKNGITVSSPCQDSRALEIIKCRSKKLTVPDISELSVKKCEIGGNEFLYRGERFVTRLSGKYQIYNALTAIETVRASGLNVSEKALFSGLAEAVFPARLELLSENPLTVLDGAHNADGATALAECMKPYSKRITAIIGVMKDKNYRDVLKLTLPHCKRMIAVRADDSPRALDVQTLVGNASEYCADVVSADSFSSALDIARETAGEDPIFIYGSLYLASGIRRLFSPDK